MYDSNYENDYRVIARRKAGCRKFDPETMLIEVYYRGPEGDVEEQLPAVYALCPTCKGKGKHVNPAIDAGGVTFEYPEDAQDYMAGVYDVRCFDCAGNRVIGVLDRDAIDSETLARIDAAEREREECEALARAERSMGA